MQNVTLEPKWLEPKWLRKRTNEQKTVMTLGIKYDTFVVTADHIFNTMIFVHHIRAAD